jgi:hypothetical protein
LRGREARRAQPRHFESASTAPTSANGRCGWRLVALDDLHEIAAKRELYRRLARTSDDLREVAERVWYSVLKES